MDSSDHSRPDHSRKAYSPREAAVALGVSVKTVRRRIADGSLVAYNIGSDAAPRIRISSHSLERFLRRKRV